MTGVRRRSRWLVPFGEGGAGPTVVCLPHAGGSPWIFREWQGHTEAVTLLGVHLPGRDDRFGEPPFRSLDSLVDALLPELSEVGKGEWALYGHSMGALVAYETARRAAGAGLSPPWRLFLAGAAAPHTPPPPEMHARPRDELVDWLVEHNDLDPEVLEYPGLLDLMLSTLRADLEAAETYRYQEHGRIGIPLHVFGGESDSLTPVDGLRSWQELTTAETRVEVLPGGHFFVSAHAARIVSVMEDTLRVDLKRENS